MKNTEHSSFHATALAAVNEALVTLGQDVVLSELNVASSDVNSRKAAYVYESSRLKVLRDHNWNFARSSVRLNGCGCSADSREQFPFETLKPAKCLRLIMCYDEIGEEVHYQVQGNAIRADAPIDKVVFTADVDDLDKWSPDAYRALVLRIAADLAKPITGRINERQLQEQAYADALAAAKLADARETNVPQDAWGENHYVNAMRGGVRHRRDLFRR